MADSHLRPGAQRHVVIAGGGFAAVEAALALRALAGDAVSLEIVAPDEALRYKPSATGEPFGADRVAAFSLAEIAADAGGIHTQDTVAAVSPTAHTLRLGSGETREYDGLVLALGARRRVGIPGAMTFRDERDAGHVREIVGGLVDGRLRHVAFAVPAGVTWTLPIYELAVLTARRLEHAGVSAELVVVTPEKQPLEVFGSAASNAVAGVLAEHGVRLLTSARPRVAHRDRLDVSFGPGVRADRVIAIPRLVGAPVPGIPGDWNGFVATAAHGRVQGVEDVYAAGDLASYPVKQGGLATQAADAAAADIARRLGADVAPPAGRRMLRARLLGPAEPLYLRSELDQLGRPLERGSVTSVSPWWPGGKVVGRYLSPYLAERATVDNLVMTR